MSALFDQMQATLGAVFGAVYLDGTLHAPTTTYAADGDPSTTWADFAIKGQVDQVSETMRQAAGYTASQQRLIVLQSSSLTRISTDYEITLGGVRWKIAAVEADPVNSHWILRGERA